MNRQYKSKGVNGCLTVFVCLFACLFICLFIFQIVLFNMPVTCRYLISVFLVCYFCNLTVVKTLSETHWSLLYLNVKYKSKVIIAWSFYELCFTAVTMLQNLWLLTYVQRNTTENLNIVCKHCVQMLNAYKLLLIYH